MRQRLVMAVVAPVVLMAASGCASKGWVRETIGKQETEMDRRFVVVEGRAATVEGRVSEEAQRLDRVEGRVGEGAQRIEGMGFRMATVESSVGEIGEAAKTAGARAAAAMARAEEVDGRLTRLWSRRHARSVVETVEVHFAFDRAMLDDGAQTALLPLIKELRENPNLTVDLHGYSDRAGARDYNVRLSQRRVEAVRRHLVENGVELPRIHAIGLGPQRGDVKAEASARQRRVTVKVMVAQE